LGGCRAPDHLPDHRWPPHDRRTGSGPTLPGPGRRGRHEAGRRPGAVGTQPLHRAGHPGSARRGDGTGGDPGRPPPGGLPAVRRSGRRVEPGTRGTGGGRRQGHQRRRRTPPL
ncbi:uncharacterized protein METZ01_LOCUS10376, partial [marine metagenome]